MPHSRRCRERCEPSLPPSQANAASATGLAEMARAAPGRPGGAAMLRALPPYPGGEAGERGRPDAPGRACAGGAGRPGDDAKRAQTRWQKARAAGRGNALRRGRVGGGRNGVVRAPLRRRARRTRRRDVLGRYRAGGAGRPGGAAAPGRIVRWTAPGTTRCGMKGRCWAALHGICYYPIDLLHKPALITIARSGTGPRELAHISVAPSDYRNYCSDCVSCLARPRVLNNCGLR